MTTVHVSRTTKTAKPNHHTQSLYVAYQQTEVAVVQVVGVGPLVPVAGPEEWEESYVPLHQ